MVIRPLPVPHPEQLVQVTSGEDDRGGYFTNPIWEQVRDRATGFTAIAAFGLKSFDIADGGESRFIHGHWASGDFFNLFGMQPAVGRLFTKADDVRGCSGMGVLGYGFWQSEYGGQRDVVGKSISIEGKPFQIIGVVARGFSGPEVGREAQLYAPLCSEGFLRGESSSLDRRSNWWLRVMGRRDPEVSTAQVSARLKAIAAESYAATLPPNWAARDKVDYLKRSFAAHPAQSGMSSVRQQYSTPLKILMGAVGLVLLIACANVANLLLARAAVREREVAIRLAIGATRRRLVRQLLTESAMLAVLGAAGGLLVGHWGTRALVALIATPDDPVALDLGLNLRVLGFTALVAMMTAMLFGLVPAWRGTRVSPQTAMKAGGRGVLESGGHGRITLGKMLVAAQVALSLTLLVGAGLLIGSLRNLTTLDPGFRAEGILLASLNLSRTGLPMEQMAAIQRDVLERLRATPGIRSASASDITPVGGMAWNDELHVDGFMPKSRRDGLAWFNKVSEGYFTTMETKLLAGRDFDRTDVPTGVKTAIINESLAHKFFGKGSPLGRQFRTKRGDTFSDPLTIVGVVEDAKYRHLREDSSETVYLPASQSTEGGPWMTLEIRTDGDPTAVIPVAKSILTGVHRLVGMEFRLLSDQLSASLQRERMLALLSGIFGGVALALSMLGLYGVMAYSVARRRNEIGVRIALGANNARVLRLVLGDVARVVAIGLVLGAAGALASGKLVSAFLFGLTPADPRVLAIAVAMLALVALGAGFIPALRAARLDPVAALRED